MGSVFNANTTNERTISADNIYLSDFKKGQVLTAGDNGQIVSSTSQTISSIPFLDGVTKCNIEMGYSWLESNYKDESAKLNSLISNSSNELTNLGFTDYSPKTIVVETRNGFIYLNDRITIPDNVNLEFRCMVACGNNFNLQLAGLYWETPTELSNAPVNYGDVNEGDTYIVADLNGKENPIYQVGDYIAIRNTSLNQRQDNQITAVTGLEAERYRLDLASPIAYFDIPNHGGTIRKYVYKTLTSPASRGDVQLKLNSTSQLYVGQYIAIADKRKAGDIEGLSNVKPNGTSKLWYSNNQFKYEIRLIIEVDAGNNTIKLESPLSNDYDTTNTYMIVMKPRYNAHIKGLKFFYVHQEYPRNNRHGITLDACVNCSVSDIVFSDSFPEINSNVQYPNINNLIRLRETHSCTLQNVIATRNKSTYSASGASYGVTSYYNSYCYFDNIYLTSFRHNVLLQSSDHTTWNNIVIKNPLISGFDMHGLNETDNYITNLLIDCSKDEYSLDSNNIDNGNSTIGMIRLGNSTHPTGTAYNVFDGFTLKWGLPSNVVTNVYGVELVPRSVGNIFKNGVIENVDTAIACYDHPRGRLNTTMVTSNNIFDNMLIRECKNVIDIDGAKNIDTTFFKVDATVANQTGTSNIILDTTSTLADYSNMFNGWILQHASGSNFSVANYDATSKQVILTSTITTSVNDPLVLRDSLTRSTNPIRDFTFTNSVVFNSSNIVYVADCADVKLVNNFINSNQGNAYVFDVVNCSNASIYNNIIENTKRFFEGSNTSNINIVNNHLINLSDERILNDLGGNSNLLWKHNHCSGFVPTFSGIQANTYLKLESERYGYKQTPSKPLMTLDNSNGYIGVNNSNPSCDMHIMATRNIPVQIETTSATFCALTLKDSNTTNSNMVQVRSSNNLMVLRSSNIDTLYLSGGRIGIGKERTAGRVHIYENGTNTPIFNFDNSNQINADSNNINTNAQGAYYGRILVRVEGVGNKWIGLFN
jgi:hypothetical protein